MNHSKIFALLMAVAACGDDDTTGTNVECAAGTTLVSGECVADVMCGAGTTASNGECVADVMCGPNTVAMNGVCVPTVPPTEFVQIEHLARPGIAEALLLSDGFLAGYNATAPTFAGVPAATLDMVIAEAKTVLKAIYLGTCLINGEAGLSTTTGALPAGLTCAAVGAADMFSDANNTVLETAVAAGAQAYADKVFGQFILDVMRIDTSVDSNYETLCGDADSAPVLCGGRKLTDDVIDVTYHYLLAGLAVPTGLSGNVPQALALVSDGVYFSADPADYDSERGAPDPTNPNQFHPNVSSTFPYSAPPL